MWTMTTIGFYSTVALTSKPGHVMVRGRVKKHLMNFIHKMNKVTGVRYDERDLLEQPSSDYRWRVIVPNQHMVETFSDLMKSIHYDNFKAECAENQRAGEEINAKYVKALTQVWNVMYGLQEDSVDFF